MAQDVESFFMCLLALFPGPFCLLPSMPGTVMRRFAKDKEEFIQEAAKHVETGEQVSKLPPWYLQDNQAGCLKVWAKVTRGEVLSACVTSTGLPKMHIQKMGDLEGSEGGGFVPLTSDTCTSPSEEVVVSTESGLEVMKSNPGNCYHHALHSRGVL
jgi:hypothetical protein